jgi:hypothetical protein
MTRYFQPYEYPPQVKGVSNTVSETPLSALVPEIGPDSTDAFKVHRQI